MKLCSSCNHHTTMSVVMMVVTMMVDPMMMAMLILMMMMVVELLMIILVITMIVKITKTTKITIEVMIMLMAMVEMIMMTKVIMMLVAIIIMIIIIKILKRNFCSLTSSEFLLFLIWILHFWIQIDIDMDYLHKITRYWVTDLCEPNLNLAQNNACLILPYRIFQKNIYLHNLITSRRLMWVSC